MKQDGFGLLITIVILGVLIFSWSLFWNFMVLDRLAYTLSKRESSQTFYLADSCLKEVIYRISRYGFAGDALEIEGHRCDVKMESRGKEYTIQAEVKNRNSVRRIIAVVDIKDKIPKLKSWKEI
ncbi:MAG: hypothetical protein HY602_02735 [Parcubacteria group bacterium]|nr:hypothetical protein [Parcubacteria group bacterium]